MRILKKNKKKVGWRRMKQIAEKAMERGNFTCADVINDLKELRKTYEEN